MLYICSMVLIKILIKTVAKVTNKIQSIEYMATNSLKTKYQAEKEAKELKIYLERKSMLSKPDSMATVVDEKLITKYSKQGVNSKSTIWFICKRVEKRLKQKAENAAKTAQNVAQAAAE